MTHTDPVEDRLIAILRAPITTHQAARLDTRISAARDAASVRRLALGVTRRVALVAVVLLILPLGAAAAGILGGGTESPHGLVDARGFQAEITAAEAVVPIPSGMSWPASINAKDGNYSAGGGRVQVENTAFCLWSQAWLEATATGEAAAAQQALGVLEAYPTWTSYTGEFATQSYRDVIDVVIDGARAGRLAPVTRFVSINCAGL